MAWDGKSLFASGTELPLSTSTQVGAAAAGRPFAAMDFEREPGWEQPTDRLMQALGFRSGCAVPVRRPGGEICAVASLSSTLAGVDYARRIDALAGEADSLVGLLEPIDVDDSTPALTRREGDLLGLLDRGLRFKQIAGELAISETTAKGYARSLFRKLGASSRAEAVFEARRRRLLD